MVSMVANDAFTQALTNPPLSRSVYDERASSDVGFKIVQGTRRLTQVISRSTAAALIYGDSLEPVSRAVH